MKDLRCFIESRAFKDQGAGVLAREASRCCDLTWEEGLRVVGRWAEVMEELPYRATLRRGKPAHGVPAPMSLVWRLGCKTVVWHDIAQDVRCSSAQRILLQRINEELEEYVALHAVYRSFVAAGVRMQKVQRGLNYNSLSKGPGSGKRRQAVLI